MRYLTLIFFCLSSCSVHGQIITENLEQLVEIYIEENDDAGDFTEVYEWMLEMYSSKINLNKAGITSLMRVPFFNPKLVSEVIEHRKKFGKFINIYELQVLPSFSKNIIERILPFVFISENQESLKELLKQSNQKLFLRYEDDLEKPKGFKEGAYKGHIGKTYFRYQNTLGKRASFGLVLENDAYEPILKKGHLVDYFSFHFQLKETGVLKNLVLGDYQANFGQGLLLGAGFGGFKSFESTSVGTVYQGVKKYSSVNENLFLRGVASTFNFNWLEITSFASRNRIDASLKSSPDSLGSEMFFNSTQTSGFHRTESERSSKDKLLKQDFGLHVRHDFGKINLGLTFLGTSFSEHKRKGVNLYQAQDISGNVFHAVSMNYNCSNKNALFSGEFALQNGEKFATIHKVLVSLSSKTDVLYVYRFYEPGYFAPNGKSFGEKATLSNETGIYMGVSTSFNNHWTLNLYGDYYSFPWLRYGLYSPTRGKEFAFKINRNYTKLNNYYIRFKTEVYGVQNKYVKILNFNPTFFNRDTYIKETINARQMKARIHFNYLVHNKVSASTRMELSFYKEKYNYINSKGILFFQEFKYAINRRWNASIRGVFFDTDDYNSRIYTYEQNVLYNFTTPTFYDKGVRSYLLVQYKPSYTISLQAKFGRTSFKNRLEIGSGNDLLKSSHKTTLTFQAMAKW